MKVIKDITSTIFSSASDFSPKSQPQLQQKTPRHHHWEPTFSFNPVANWWKLMSNIAWEGKTSGDRAALGLKGKGIGRQESCLVLLTLDLVGYSDAKCFQSPSHHLAGASSPAASMSHCRAEIPKTAKERKWGRACLANPRESWPSRYFLATTLTTICQSQWHEQGQISKQMV